MNETSQSSAPSRSNEEHERNDGRILNQTRHFHQTSLNFSNGQPGSSGGRRVRRWGNPKGDDRRQKLADIAAETIHVLPEYLGKRSDVTTDGYLSIGDRVGALDPKYCPKLPSVTVHVINKDTIAAALDMQQTPSSKPVCILNMASEKHAGGGFRNGAMAQEEALCYRSSLFFTLKTRFYPIPAEAGIYTPVMLIIREGIEDGHQLLNPDSPAVWPVLSCVSVAAVRRPPLKREKGHANSYENDTDRLLMEQKMRIILRIAARNGHRKLILGALGCGAFRNPPEQVAGMWKKVLQEPEFGGGWWEEVVFAIIDRAGSGNYGIFSQELEGLEL